MSRIVFIKILGKSLIFYILNNFTSDVFIVFSLFRYRKEKKKLLYYLEFSTATDTDLSRVHH